MQSGRIELDWLVTHRLPLDDAEAAVELLTGDAGEVLLVPGTDSRQPGRGGADDPPGSAWRP